VHSTNTHRCSSACGPSSRTRCLSALELSRDLPCNTRTDSLQPAHSQSYEISRSYEIQLPCEPMAQTIIT